MLEVTAEANNRNARQLSFTKYKDEMDRIAGPGVSEYKKGHEVRTALADTHMQPGRGKSSQEMPGDTHSHPQPACYAMIVPRP
jgi:hypothetical protein